MSHGHMRKEMFAVPFLVEIAAHETGQVKVKSNFVLYSANSQHDTCRVGVDHILLLL